MPRLSSRPNQEVTPALGSAAARRRSNAVSVSKPAVVPKPKRVPDPAAGNSSVVDQEEITNISPWVDFSTNSSLPKIVANLKRTEPDRGNVSTTRPSSGSGSLAPARRAGRAALDAVVPPRRPVIDWEQNTAATQAGEEYNTVQMMPEPKTAPSAPINPLPTQYESPQLDDTYAVAQDALGSGYDNATDRHAAHVHGKLEMPKTCVVSIDGKMQIRDPATGSIVRETGVNVLRRSSVTVTDRQLGDGYFGVVMEGHWTQRLPGGRSRRERVAVKMLKRTDRLGDRVPVSQIAEEHANMLVEAETMAKFDHKNVVRLLGCVLPGVKEDVDMCFLVVKFAMKGSLLNILQKKQRVTGHLFEYSVGIARGMEHRKRTVPEHQSRHSLDSSQPPHAPVQACSRHASNSARWPARLTCMMSYAVVCLHRCSRIQEICSP